MTPLKVKKIMCSLFGHRTAVEISSYKKKKLRNNSYSYTWDVNKITYCKRCGLTLNKERLHRNLTPHQYLKMYAYD